MYSTEQKENGHCASHNYAEMAHNAGRKVREVFDTVNDEAHAMTDTAVKKVREHPVQSSLVALGVGFLAGLLFRRR